MSFREGICSSEGVLACGLCFFLLKANKLSTKGKMLSCSMCNFESNTIEKYNRHLYKHRSRKFGEFKCLWADCGVMLSLYRNYQAHWFRKHSEEKRRNNTKCSIYKCSVFSCNFKTHDLKGHLKHCANHLNFGNKIQCPIENCCKWFENKLTFRTHVYRKHNQCEYKNRVTYQISERRPNVYQNSADIISNSCSENNQGVQNNKNPLQHFCQLTGLESENFIHNFIAEKDNMTAFLKKFGSKYLTLQDSDEDDISIIEALIKYFNEEQNLLFKKYVVIHSYLILFQASTF